MISKKQADALFVMYATGELGLNGVQGSNKFPVTGGETINGKYYGFSRSTPEALRSKGLCKVPPGGFSKDFDSGGKTRKDRFLIEVLYVLTPQGRELFETELKDKYPAVTPRLAKKLIKKAFDNPELRSEILPLVKPH